MIVKYCIAHFHLVHFEVLDGIKYIDGVWKAEVSSAISVAALDVLTTPYGLVGRASIRAQNHRQGSAWDELASLVAPTRLRVGHDWLELPSTLCGVELNLSFRTGIKS